MAIAALALISGIFRGYSQKKQAEAEDTRYENRLQTEYDYRVRAANDPMHPDYWGIQNTKSLIASRLMSGDPGATRHTMGLEGWIGQYLTGTDNTPVFGEDSHHAMMAGVASGLSFNEYAGGKDEWVNRLSGRGRSLASALYESGLDLGSGVDGKEMKLAPDRYGEGMSQLEFMDEAVDEFAPYVQYLANPDPDLAFEDSLKSVPGSPEYEKAMEKFQMAKAFWSTGFGGAYFESEKRGAPQAVHQALDRMARAQGILNGEVLSKAAPKVDKTTPLDESTPAVDTAAREEIIFDAITPTRGSEQVFDLPPPVAQQGLPPVLQASPGVSAEAMDLQFQAVSEVVQLIANDPGSVTPEMLELLELKSKQGFWSHIIDPALNKFRESLKKAETDDQMNALLRDMRLGQPRTHMLGGSY